MGEFALVCGIVLCAVAVVALAVTLFVSQRQWAEERSYLLDDVRCANRSAVRAALAHSGLDYERAEGVAAVIDARAKNPDPPREPEPAPVGLG